MDVEIAPMITSHFDPAKMVDTKAIRGQVKELMHTKMEMLTPEWLAVSVRVSTSTSHLSVLGGFIIALLMVSGW